MRGAPYDLSSTTLRPLGPSVTRTALARTSMPRSILSRASTENFTSLADISRFLSVRLHPHRQPKGRVRRMSRVDTKGSRETGLVRKLSAKGRGGQAAFFLA